MTSKTNTSQLVKAIEQLPRSKVRYEKPDAEVMCDALAEKMGMQADLFKKELAEMRQKVEAERQEKVRAEVLATQERQKAAEERHRCELAEDNRRQAVKEADATRSQQQLITNVLTMPWCLNNLLPGSWDHNTVAKLIGQNCKNAYLVEVWRSNSYLGNTATLGIRNCMWHGIRVYDDEKEVLTEMGQFDSGSWVYSIDAKGDMKSRTAPA